MRDRPKELISEKSILKIIMVIRGEKVISDSGISGLYDVETKRLNKQVR